jgi:hypothetical protein
MLSASSSTLVAGGARANMDKSMKVKVTRAFLHAGKVLPVGAVVELPAAVAHDVIYRQRAELVVDAPKPVASAETKESKK